MVNGIYPIIKNTNKVNSFIIIFIPSIACILSTIYGIKMCTLGFLALHGVMTKSICENLGNPSWSKTAQKLDLSTSLKWCFHSLFSCIWTLSCSEGRFLSRCWLLQLLQSQNSLRFLSWVTICLPSHTDTWRWVNVEMKTNPLNNFKASSVSFYNLEFPVCFFMR